MKEKIYITLDENHYLNCEEITIARRDENDVKEFEIKLPENLTDYWVYIDFEKPDGKKIKTPKLNVTDGIAYYVIPNSIVDIEGTLKTQIVLQKDTGEIWKSDTKTFFVENSVNATDDIPNQDDFITEAQKILDGCADLDNVLRDILEAIQTGDITSNTIAEIEQIIVSYFENKTAEEVEA
jgi:hypothetical protein